MVRAGVHQRAGHVLDDRRQRALRSAGPRRRRQRDAAVAQVAAQLAGARHDARRARRRFPPQVGEERRGRRRRLRLGPVAERDRAEHRERRQPQHLVGAVAPGAEQHDGAERLAAAPDRSLRGEVERRRRAPVGDEPRHRGGALVVAGRRHRHVQRGERDHDRPAERLRGERGDRGHAAALQHRIDHPELDLDRSQHCLSINYTTPAGDLVA